MIDDKLQRTTMKANYFLRNNIDVHIKTFEGEWYNGTIIKITDDFLTVNEYKKGRKDIFLVDIKDIVAYEKEEEGDDRN